MSVTIEVLGAGELEERVRGTLDWLKTKEGDWEEINVLESRVAKHVGDFYRKGLSKRGSYLRSCLSAAPEVFALKGKAGEFHSLLKGGVDVFAPTVRLLDFSVIEQQIDLPEAEAVIFEGMEIDDNLVMRLLTMRQSRSTPRKSVTVKVRKQPAQEDVENAFIAALMAWDFDAARQMATEYQLRPSIKGGGMSRLNRLGLLREIVLENTSSALGFLENCPEKYLPDFPPPQRELAEGLIRRDLNLIRQGLQALSKRFHHVWNLKTYATKAKLQQFGSMENLLPAIRRHLLGHHWVLSNWGIALMSLAWDRGWKEAFCDPDLFCEWLPWELCCPEPKPVGTRRTAGKRKAGQKAEGKLRLREELITAAKAGDVKRIRELVAMGAPLDGNDVDRLTPLLLAVNGGHIDAVVELIKAGADLAKTDHNHRTALGIAADLGFTEMVKAILACGAPPDGADKPVTPLVRASRHGHLEIMRALLEAGADPNKESAYHNSSSIADASTMGHLEGVELLLRFGARPDGSHEHKKPALHEAARVGNPDIVALLLKNGVDCNRRDSVGWTALHCAASGGHLPVLELLVQAGADLDAQTTQGDFAGTTPLMLAVEHPTCVRALLRAGANVGLMDRRKRTAMQLAVEGSEARTMILQHLAGND
jgi:ankyrin repeat protein